MARRTDARSFAPLPSSLVLATLAFAAFGCGGGKPAPSGNLKEITTKTGQVMVLLPAGEFTMGDDSGAPDERPAHKVALDAFYMDRTEVTQESYKALTGRNPSKRKVAGGPVEQVSWYDAIQYCNRRSEKEGLTPCYDVKTGACDFTASGYRLPTEAEWEYACRSGTATRYSFGNDAASLDAYGWSKRNAGDALHPAAQKKPSPWGLCDMHGGVGEWCHDFYADKYAAGPCQNPCGPESGEKRVMRGGSWRSVPEDCRSSARFGERPGFSDVCFNADLYGFRCVRAAAK